MLARTASLIFANLLKSQNFVIPVRRGDGDFDNDLAKLKHWRGFQAYSPRTG
jgi:hypothetical protein